MFRRIYSIRFCELPAASCLAAKQKMQAIVLFAGLHGCVEGFTALLNATSFSDSYSAKRMYQ